MKELHNPASEGWTFHSGFRPWPHGGWRRKKIVGTKPVIGHGHWHWHASSNRSHDGLEHSIWRDVQTESLKNKESSVISKNLVKSAAVKSEDMEMSGSSKKEESSSGKAKTTRKDESKDTSRASNSKSTKQSSQSSKKSTSSSKTEDTSYSNSASSTSLFKDKNNNSSKRPEASNDVSTKPMKKGGESSASSGTKKLGKGKKIIEISLEISESESAEQRVTSSSKSKVGKGTAASSSSQSKSKKSKTTFDLELEVPVSSYEGGVGTSAKSKKGSVSNSKGSENKASSFNKKESVVGKGSSSANSDSSTTKQKKTPLTSTNLSSSKQKSSSSKSSQATQRFSESSKSSTNGLSQDASSSQKKEKQTGGKIVNPPSTDASSTTKTDISHKTKNKSKVGWRERISAYPPKNGTDKYQYYYDDGEGGDSHEHSSHQVDDGGQGFWHWHWGPHSDEAGSPANKTKTTKKPGVKKRKTTKAPVTTTSKPDALNLSKLDEEQVHKQEGTVQGVPMSDNRTHTDSNEPSEFGGDGFIPSEGGDEKENKRKGSTTPKPIIAVESVTDKDIDIPLHTETSVSIAAGGFPGSEDEKSYLMTPKPGQTEHLLAGDDGVVAPSTEDEVENETERPLSTDEGKKMKQKGSTTPKPIDTAVTPGADVIFMPGTEAAVDTQAGLPDADNETNETTEGSATPKPTERGTTSQPDGDVEIPPETDSPLTIEVEVSTTTNSGLDVTFHPGGDEVINPGTEVYIQSQSELPSADLGITSTTPKSDGNIICKDGVTIGDVNDETSAGCPDQESPQAQGNIDGSTESTKIAGLEFIAGDQIPGKGESVTIASDHGDTLGLASPDSDRIDSTNAASSVPGDGSSGEGATQFSSDGTKNPADLGSMSPTKVNTSTSAAGDGSTMPIGELHVADNFKSGVAADSEEEESFNDVVIPAPSEGASKKVSSGSSDDTGLKPQQVLVSSSTGSSSGSKPKEEENVGNITSTDEKDKEHSTLGDVTVPVKPTKADYSASFPDNDVVSGDQHISKDENQKDSNGTTMDHSISAFQTDVQEPSSSSKTEMGKETSTSESFATSKSHSEASKKDKSKKKGKSRATSDSSEEDYPSSSSSSSSSSESEESSSTSSEIGSSSSSSESASSSSESYSDSAETSSSTSKKSARSHHTSSSNDTYTKSSRRSKHKSSSVNSSTERSEGEEISGNNTTTTAHVRQDSGTRSNSTLEDLGSEGKLRKQKTRRKHGSKLKHKQNSSGTGEVESSTKNKNLKNKWGTKQNMTQEMIMNQATGQLNMTMEQGGTMSQKTSTDSKQASGNKSSRSKKRRAKARRARKWKEAYKKMAQMKQTQQMNFTASNGTTIIIYSMSMTNIVKKYYNKGRAIGPECKPQRLFFSPSAGRCLPAARVRHCNATISTGFPIPNFEQDFTVPSSFCKNRQHKNYPHPKSCSKFISCHDDSAQVRHCPGCTLEPRQCFGGTLVFSPNVGECVFPTTFKCTRENGVIKRQEVQESELPEVSHDSERPEFMELCKEEGNGNYEHPECNKFISCASGVPQERLCPRCTGKICPGGTLIYNENEDACVPATGDLSRCMLIAKAANVTDASAL